MRRWSRAIPFAFALFGALPGCRADQLVELRLYPCEFAGIEPQAVTVEITGFDAEGNVVETFEVGFDDIAVSTFADGYASVGYRKHGDVDRARFRVGWFEAASAGPIAEANAIAVYDEIGVPEAGEVLVLGELAADCAELIADGTESESSDTLDTSSSDTLDTSSDDVDTSSSDTLETSSDTLETDTSTDTDTTDTTGTSGDPPGPMVGDSCAAFGDFHCLGGPTEFDAGTPLFCDGTLLEAADNFGDACIGACLDGSATPVNACGSIGYPAACLCESIGAPNCMGATLGCVPTDELHLCYMDKVVVADCPNCGTTPEGWFTCG